jgi:hypothetical protein
MLCDREFPGAWEMDGEERGGANWVTRDRWIEETAWAGDSGLFTFEVPEKARSLLAIGRLWKEGSLVVRIDDRACELEIITLLVHAGPSQLNTRKCCAASAELARFPAEGLVIYVTHEGVGPYSNEPAAASV